MEEDRNSNRDLVIHDRNRVVITQPEISRFCLTVEPLVFAFSVAESLSGSVTTNLILTRACETHFNFNKSVCSQFESINHNESSIEALVQPYAAKIITSMSFLAVLFPAFMSFFLGPWSDYNGRKLLITLPSLGYCLKYFILLVFSLIPSLNSLFVLLAVLPVAMSGGVVNLISALYSYISDTTTEENRSFRLGIFDAFSYLGTIVGLLSSSYVYKAGGDYGYLLVYGLSCGMLFLTVIFTHFFIPESLRRVEGGKGLLHVFEFKLLKEMFKVCFKKRENYGRTIIFLVIFSLTLNLGTWNGEDNVQFLYARLWFRWDIREYTTWYAITIGLQFLGLLIGTTILAKCLKLQDSILAIIAYTMKTASTFYYAFIPSNSPHLLYYIGLISFFSGLGGPAGRSVLSKSVPSEDLGKVFALTSSGEAIIPLGFGPMYTFLYNSTIHTLPSAFIILSGVFFTIIVLIYIAIYIIQKWTARTRYRAMETSNEIE